MSFFHTLKMHGVYCWEGRTCFLSTAHTRTVVDEVVAALKRTTDDLEAAGADLHRARDQP
jgi:iturin family lipopeptide synthetase A